MSTHSICFRREIRKILCGYPLLSVAMTSPKCHDLALTLYERHVSAGSCLDFFFLFCQFVF